MATKSDFRRLAEKMAGAIEGGEATLVSEQESLFHVLHRYGEKPNGQPLFEVVASVSSSRQDPEIYVLHAQAETIAPAAEEFAQKFERIVRIYEVNDDVDLGAET